MAVKGRAKRRAGPKATRPLYKTHRGRMFVSKIEDALSSSAFQKLTGKVDLILTSPPFPLVRKKRYGNETGGAYLKWLGNALSSIALQCVGCGLLVGGSDCPLLPQ